MSWSSRRRGTYIGSFLSLVLLIVIWIGVSVWYEAPTCSDGKQNGNESGVDCGGSCELVCSFQTVDPVVLWSRFFELGPGLYNAVVLIENPNVNAQSGPVEYSLKLRDAENLLVVEERGEISLPSQRTIPLFITNISTGNRVPSRSFFTFESEFVWERVTSEQPDIFVNDTVLTKTDTQPRLDGLLRNNSSQTVTDIAVVAILSDSGGNAVATSRTVVEFLDPKEETKIFFTWPKAFTESVASISVIPILPLAR